MVVLGIRQIPLPEFVAPDLVDTVMSVWPTLHARSRAQAARDVTIRIHNSVLDDHVMSAMIALPIQPVIQDLLSNTLSRIRRLKVADMDHRPDPVAQHELAFELILFTMKDCVKLVFFPQRLKLRRCQVFIHFECRIPSKNRIADLICCQRFLLPSATTENEHEGYNKQMAEFHTFAVRILYNSS